MELPIGDAGAFWREVAKPMRDAFIDKNSSVPNGLAAVLFLFHLYDKHYGVPFGQDPNQAGRFNDLGTKRMFEIAQKLSNSSKHVSVRIRTVRQSGFSSAFDSSFARPLNVIDGQDTISLDQVIDTLHRYWDERLP